MPARLTSDVAVSRLIEHEYEALEPFPGLVSSAWQVRHLQCGQEVSLTLKKLRLGQLVPCACSARLPVPANKRRPAASQLAKNAPQAIERMSAAGWEPLESYPGSHFHWRCRCTGCGSEGEPRLHDIGKTKCCRVCSGRELVTADKALEMLTAVGWRPLVPFPGPDAPWSCACVRCGHRATPSYTIVNAGKSRCRACSNREAGVRRLQRYEPAAVALIREAGLEPLEPYPGSGKSWLCKCRHCGSLARPRHSDVAAGNGGCGSCRRRKQGLTRKAGVAGPAEARVRAAGYTPLGPYPGMHATWSCLCRCGRETEVWVHALGEGSRGCRWCTEFGFKLSVPAVAYLLVNRQLAAIKVGVTAAKSTRISIFRRHGWQVAHLEEFDTGFGALTAEKQILDWWRNDLGLPSYLSPGDMPVGGSTETTELEVMPVHIAIERLCESAARARRSTRISGGGMDSGLPPLTSSALAGGGIACAQ